MSSKRNSFDESDVIRDVREPDYAASAFVRPKRRRSKGLLALIIVLLLGLAGLGLATFVFDVFDLDHSDDADKLYGKWVSQDGLASMELRGDELILGDGTVYDASVDCNNRIIHFYVGDIKGQASYSFKKDEDGSLLLVLTEILDDREVQNIFRRADDGDKDEGTVVVLHPKTEVSVEDLSGGAAAGSDAAATDGAAATGDAPAA